MQWWWFYTHPIAYFPWHTFWIIHGLPGKHNRVHFLGNVKIVCVWFIRLVWYGSKRWTCPTNFRCMSKLPCLPCKNPGQHQVDHVKLTIHEQNNLLNRFLQLPLDRTTWCILFWKLNDLFLLCWSLITCSFLWCYGPREQVMRGRTSCLWLHHVTH